MTKMPSGTTATRINLYMEHGVQERLDMLVKFHARELADRYPRVSRSSWIKLAITREYRLMRDAVIERQGKLTKIKKEINK